MPTLLDGMVKLFWICEIEVIISEEAAFELFDRTDQLIITQSNHYLPRN